jgi:DNA polymerase-3 subunit beta
MKIECLVEKILNAVLKAEKVTGKNLSLPVLSAIVFVVNKNSITIKSTNLELSFQIEVPVKVFSGEGVKFAIPANTITSFLSNLKKDSIVVFEKKGENIKISSNEIEAEINTISTNDFPNIETQKSENCFNVRAIDLFKGIRSVVFSASNSSIKPELSSVYIFSENNNLFFVSTDSFRLAEKKIKIPNLPNNINSLIPSKNIIDVIRLIEDLDDEEILVSINKNQISFSSKNLSIVSRTIEGHFPDYKHIIPKDSKTTVMVLKDDFLKAIKTITSFSDNSNQIYFKIFPIKKIFDIFSKNSNIGYGFFRLKGALEGEDIEISFNHKYITDSLQVINQDSVSLYLNGLGKPMIIRGVSDNSFLYLVMPMNK